MMTEKEKNIILSHLDEAWHQVDNNCYEFARRVLRDHFGMHPPYVFFAAADDGAAEKALADQANYIGWSPAPSPGVSGDVATIGRNMMSPSHVGVVVGDGILHCSRGKGVAFQTIATLTRTGWRVIGFWRWRGGR